VLPTCETPGANRVRQVAELQFSDPHGPLGHSNLEPSDRAAPCSLSRDFWLGVPFVSGFRECVVIKSGLDNGATDGNNGALRSNDIDSFPAVDKL